MIFPQNIKVGAHNIRVKIVDHENIEDFGEYNHYTRLIRLKEDNGIPEDAMAECFLHELFEVLDKLNNLNLNHVALTVLSEGIFQIIRDNKLDFRKSK